MRKPSGHARKPSGQVAIALNLVIAIFVVGSLGIATYELTRVLQMLDAVQARLGIVDHHSSDLADLEMETKPEDVLAEIERLHKQELNRA